MHVVKDSILIYSTIPDEFSIKKYDLTNRMLMDEIKIKTEDHNESFFYANRGYVAANDSAIMYVYTYKRQIDVFNIETLKKTKKVIGNYSYKKPRIGDFVNNTYYYIDIFAGKKNFYALYQGYDGRRENQKQGRTLEVFDNLGNPVVKYSFDRSPDIFIVDEENGVIYGYSDDFEDYLLRYKI